MAKALTPPHGGLVACVHIKTHIGMSLRYDLLRAHGSESIRRILCWRLRWCRILVPRFSGLSRSFRDPCLLDLL